MPRPTLLIVEDDDASRELLRKLFARRGWDVTTAATLAAALAALDPPPDCLVLDLLLPDGDGAAVLRQIRAADLPTRVAVCTAVQDWDRLAKVQRLRPEALLHKPIDVEEVARAIGIPVP